MTRVTRDSALEPLRHVGRVLLQKEETPTPTSRTKTKKGRNTDTDESHRDICTVYDDSSINY